MKRFPGVGVRLPLALLVAAFLVFALAACGDDDDDGGGGNGGADGGSATAGVSLECKDGRILVGLAKADSGLASFFDIAGKRGAQIAIDQINEDGGIKGCPIETIEGDTKSDPAVGAQVARSLIDQGAQILLVPDDFDLGIAAARVGQEAGVLTLSTAASSTEFGSAVGDLFFNGGVTTTELANAQARFADDEGFTTAYQVVDPGLAYFTEQEDKFADAFSGEIVGSDKVDSLGGQADFGSSISKIQSANPDVIQTLMIFPAVGTFIKQLRSAGVDTPVLGNVTSQTRELPPLVGKSRANDIYYSGQVYFEGAGLDPESDPQIDEFAEQYEAKFGNFPEQANGPGSYQMLLAVNEALQQEDVVDAGSAAEAIRGLSNVDVPGGTLVRFENGYAIWNPTLDAVQNGEFEQVAQYNAAELRGE
jgi:branched-chain amino acid transport system substrate-binding protein